jgi:hypothetical protein
MRRASLLAVAALIGVALVSPQAVESAAKLRFTLTIEGTQRFEWTIEGGRDARGQPGPCAFTGTGRQVVTFGTARPVTVLVPPGQGLSGGYGGDAFLNAATRRRSIAVTGQETREYRVLQPPNPATCPNLDGSYPGYGRACSGTNPFLPSASVVVLRYNPIRYNPKRLSRQRAMVYAPVDVLLFERKPKQCDLRLFDLRNYLISQLITVGEYLALKGGRFEQRATKIVTGAESVRLCVDPFGSGPANADLQSCSKPKRQGELTGEITVNWTLTFRRAR